METRTTLIRYFINDIDPKRSLLWLSICTATNVATRLLDHLVGPELYRC